MASFTDLEMREYLEGLISEYPICEYSFGSPADIPITDKVYTICETDCPRYGKCWACPPFAGDIAFNIDRMKHYHSYLVFSTVWEVSDAFNFDACLFVKKEHEVMTREIREKILSRFEIEKSSMEAEPFPKVHVLSSGCSICEECACPDEPCRHPEDRLMSMESHGMLIIQLADTLGLTTQYDGTTAVYFTMILF